MVQRLNALAALVRGPLPSLHRNIITALITIDVHARDIVTDLVRQKVKHCSVNAIARTHTQVACIYACSWLGMIGADIDQGFSGDPKRFVTTHLLFFRWTPDLTLNGRDSYATTGTWTKTLV